MTSRLRVVILVMGSLLPTVAFADSFAALQKDAGAAGAAIQQFAADHNADIAAEKLDSNEDFFPDTGTGAGKRQGNADQSNGFVVFRVNGVPYVLKDVPTDSWFGPYVRDVANQGIVSGYKDTFGNPSGIFAPDRQVSIQELAKMAVVTGKINPDSCKGPAKNPQAKGWSLPYITCAEQHGFAVFADGTVDPSRPATRAEVVVTVLQALGVALKDMPPGSTLFSDVTPSTLFSSAIYTAVQDHIVAGYTDAAGRPTHLFKPDQPVNRAEIAKMISIAVQVYPR